MNNRDHISRSKIRKAIEELPNANPSYSHTCDVVERDEVFEIIDNAQALERPKCEWKCTVHSTYRGYYKDGEPVWGSSKVYTCPECGRCTIIKENFCPTCGADMRGAG